MNDPLEKVSTLTVGPAVAPEGWEFRSQQEETLERIRSAWAAGKKVVAVQGPTGSGKSLIGVAAAMAVGRSYYLVPMKSLQDQIATDFKGTLNIFKGKSNYTCTQFPTKQFLEKNPGQGVYRVDQAPCQERGMSEQRKTCRVEQYCPYYNAFQAAAEGAHALMNFSLYLAWMRLKSILPPERVPFGQRALHVIDEAHKVEDFVRDFLTVELSARQLSKYLSLEDAVVGLEDDTIQPFLQTVNELNNAEIESLEKEFNTNQLEATATEIGSDKIDFHTKLKEKLETYFKDPDNYVFQVEDRYAYGQPNKYIVVKPLYVGNFINSCVAGERTLLLSATLTKKSVLQMGFKEEELEYIDLPSTFPPTNRLIHFDCVGALNKNNIERLTYEIACKVENILLRYPKSKGIVHTPSYKFTQALLETMDDSFRPRILAQDKDENTAKKIMENHVTSPDPTVLFTPGMKEGVDLKGELSRFQIIVKAPYPNLGDAAIKAMADKDPLWYKNRAVIDFLQMYGRSIRSETDYAETYCLDNNLRGLIRDNKFMIPKWVMEAVRWVG